MAKYSFAFQHRGTRLVLSALALACAALGAERKQPQQQQTPPPGEKKKEFEMSEKLSA